MIPSIILAISSFTSPSSTPDLPGPPEPKAPGTDRPTQRYTPPPRKEPPRGRLISPHSDKRSEAPQEPAGDFYIYPGVVGIKEGRWSGGDNFLNLSKSIALQVNILKPNEEAVSLGTEQLKQKVQQILESNNFSIRNSGIDGKPPEPFFNLLVLIYPQKRGFAAAIVGRLFEEIKPERFNLSRETAFQAVTWEQINLIVGSIDELPRLIENSVESLVNNFARKVNSFQAASENEGRVREVE